MNNAIQSRTRIEAKVSRFQLASILGLARWLKRDANLLSVAWFRRRPTDLTATQADQFLARLKGLRPARAGRV
jgi:hypothetical protein